MKITINDHTPCAQATEKSLSLANLINIATYL